MFCTNCGKSLEPETRFCPGCGTAQSPQPRARPSSRAAASPVTAMSAPDGGGKGGRAAVWAGAAVLALGLAGGAGYWSWSGKTSNQEAVPKPAAQEQAGKAAAEDAKSRAAEAEKQRATAEKAAEAAEIARAEALLDRHIAAEEAQALAGGKTRPAGQANSKTVAGTR